MKELALICALAAAPAAAPAAAAPAPPRPAPTAAAPAPAAKPAPPAVDPSVAALVAKMQKVYERAKGFDTRFEQRFIATGMPSRLGGNTGKGQIRFRKPQGKSGPWMRWDYSDGRIFLLVGDRTFFFDPEVKQVTEYPLDVANLSAAVTFMWGRGRLADEFVIARAARPDLAGDGVALELTPRKPTGGFSRVFLVVDPATGLVRRSVVVLPNGNENQIGFVEPRTDVAFTPGDFDPRKVFPAGVPVTRAAIPGR